MAATVATRQKRRPSQLVPKKKKLQRAPPVAARPAATRRCPPCSDPSLPALPMDTVIVAGENDSDLGS
jgi:hypothetical protein